ncbi:HAD family hydrolase [Acetomicrobium sp. UBA5826]|uniref:HAD family hydrolase n=1 Tax=Acetomicrobium sp. UBA5826 TaxID=1946039 RepID=UPI00257C8F9A|nr:HAD family hydrolase [Acetomicrobium sp. UBA5826]
MKVRALLFDFDMTLVDTSHAIAYAMNYFARIMGLRAVSYEEVLSTIGIPMEKSLRCLWNEFRPEWLDIYSKECRPLEYERMKLFPGTEEVLQALRNRGLMLAITSNRRKAKKAVRHLGIDKYFDIVLGLEDVDRAKPDPYILFKAVESLGVDKDEAIYVGDTVIDMETANNADIMGIGLATGPNSAEDLKKAGALMVLSDIKEIPNILTCDGFLIVDEAKVGN